MNKFGYEYVDKYIKKNVNNNTVSYNVFIWRHDLKVNERFETLEKAQAFRDEALRLCELKRIESIRASLEITDYPYNLINALEFDVASVIEHFEERLKKVIEKHLTPREEIVLTNTYVNHKTLEEIGKEYGITRERVRQILIKALRKIKVHKKYFEIGDLAYPEIYEKEQRDKYIEEIKSKWTYESAKKIVEEYEMTNEDIKKKNLLDTPIEDLDFSVRTYNCLKRAYRRDYATGLRVYDYINTLGDLIECEDVDLMKIRNLGRKSLKEIIEKVHSYGFKLKGEK